MFFSPAGSQPSNEELACRAQEGCVESFALLARRLQGPVLHFLLQRVAAADAEDLVQDTFLRAYQRLGRYRSQWPFATWLFTIAHRLSVNHHRRARPTTDSEALRNVESRTPQPLDTIVLEEGRQGLWDTARRVLGQQQVTALWLYYVEDMPVKHIAWVLGCSRPAVKTMLFRARKKLIPCLGNLLEEQGAADSGSETERAARSSAAEVPHV
jgi:RNA polymerase sigma-70 factor, ECF subfamily